MSGTLAGQALPCGCMWHSSSAGGCITRGVHATEQAPNSAHVQIQQLAHNCPRDTSPEGVSVASGATL